MYAHLSYALIYVDLACPWASYVLSGNALLPVLQLFSIGQCTGNIVKLRYFCHTEYYLEIP